MINHLINQNIWWQSKSLIANDPKIREFSRQGIQWEPALMDQFDLSTFHIYTLRGPRQVGKTTMLKLMIKKLLDNPQISKKQVLYYSSDNIDSYKEIIELLETYFGFINGLPNPPERAFIFLDEITGIKQWQRGIKYLVDTGVLENTAIILSGSSASDLRTGIERLPGRRGSGTNLDKILLPASFREFVSLVSPETFSLLSNAPPFDPFKITKELYQELHALKVHLVLLNRLLNRYLLSGGFLRAINRHSQNNTIDPDVYELYLQWIRGDIVKAGKNERTARQIVSELLKISVSTFGWDTIAKKIDVGAHKTVSEHILSLEDSFVLRVLYQVDLNTGMPRIKKMKKAYFSDPFILWTLRGWTEGWLIFYEKSCEKVRDELFKSCLAEMLVANALFRQYQSTDWTRANIMFFRNKGEIDFLIKKDERLMPVEVKYQKNAGISDIRLMRKLGFRNGIIVSRETFFYEDGFMGIPLGIFLVISDYKSKANNA